MLIASLEWLSRWSWRLPHLARCLPHEPAGRASDLERAELIILGKVEGNHGQPHACVFNIVRMIAEASGY